MDITSLRRRVSFVLMILIVAIFNADQNLLYPNFLQVMREFGVGEIEMGLVSSAFVTVSIITSIIWGFFSDIYSRKKLLLIGVMLGEVPCFLTAFAQDYLQLLVLRIFTGIGIGSLTPLTFTLVADMFDESRRGAGYGYMGMASGLGTLMGMIVAGLSPDWRSPFIYVAIPNWVLAPLFYIIYSEPKRGESESVLRELYERGFEYTYRLSWDAVKKSLRTKTNIYIFIQGAIGTVPWGVIVTWLVTFFILVRGMGKETATLMLLILGVTTQVGNVIGGYLGDWAERRRRGGRALFSGAAILLGVLTSMGFVLYPLPSELGLIEWVFVVIYASLLLSILSYAGPNVSAIMSQVNLPEDRGTIYSVQNVFGSIGNAVGPLLGGALIVFFKSLGYTEASAYIYTIIAGILFWIPCALIWILIYKHYPRDQEEIKKTLEERIKRDPIE